ncbi:MAG: hypothetical protein M1816_002723 [Peltula sp. TS41687]|nr:MAG: hypothetical protein M1816_002723 [Peltula sp. TS41687]
MAVPQLMPKSQFDAIIFSLYAVAVLTTLLRLYCRRFVLGALGADDALITCAIIMGAATAALYHKKLEDLYIFFPTFVNNPAKFKDPRSIMPFIRGGLRLSFLQNLVYVIELGFIKLAILAFYHRIAVAKRHQYTLYMTGSLIIGFTLAFMFAKIFQGVPVRASWDVSVPLRGTRIDVEKLDIANSGFQTAIDFILLVLPLSVVVKLNTNRKAKAGLVVLFSLGIFSFAATIVRLSLSIKYKGTKDVIKNLRLQPTYSAWTQSELNVAIVCANMPALWTLAKWLLQGRSMTKPSEAGYDRYPSGRTPPRGNASGGSQDDFGQRGAMMNAVTGGQRTSYNEKPDGITYKTEVSMDVNETAERYGNHHVV